MKRKSRTAADVAPDGSPVEFFALLPPDGEPEIIHGAAPDAAEILELGCGAGRITHALIALGHRVVAVDQSAAMLAHVRGAEKVHADIESLDLGRHFPCVVLASNLVNMAEESQCAAFLSTCGRHVASDGIVIVERLDPVWALTASDYQIKRNGVGISFQRTGTGKRRFSATMRYTLGAAAWEHSFTARVLDDDELASTFAAAGLRRTATLDPAGRWIVARPID